MLALIESSLLDDYKDCGGMCEKEFDRDDLDLDEDVENEEDRIADMRFDGGN